MVIPSLRSPPVSNYLGDISTGSQDSISRPEKRLYPVANLMLISRIVFKGNFVAKGNKANNNASKVSRYDDNR